MKITRLSPFTMTIATMDIDVTRDQISNWENGTLIQDAMPNVSAEHREFIKTGITPEQWDRAFSEPETTHNEN